MNLLALILLGALLLCTDAQLTFPTNFKFGVATAAYQVEGAWNVSGKNDSMWDYLLHANPSYVQDDSNGDVACDAYHKIDDDIANLVKLKVNYYRFSISWSRLLPSGYTNYINPDGVRYYNELINKLLSHNIEPYVTIYHWDLPQTINEIGGFTNARIADYVADFAKICFELFGDRVKTWITFNEPLSVCSMGYGFELLAPFVHSDGIGSYVCAHNLLRAHAKMYKIYKMQFQSEQKGRIGIAIETSWFEPYNNTSKSDLEASERILQMSFGWFAHPIFSKDGDYPRIMRERIDNISKQQGLLKSRLPTFTPQEIHDLRGSHDFLGLNHYTTEYAELGSEIVTPTPSYMVDVNVKTFIDKSWTPTARLISPSVPWGIRTILKWIKKEYYNVDVLITENGYAGYKNETLDDYPRVNYINDYLSEVLKAIHIDGCNVIGYTSWSYMDNFEWSNGYTYRFGMYYIDFDDDNRPRTPKRSAYVYQNIIVTRQINDTLYPDNFLY